MLATPLFCLWLVDGLLCSYWKVVHDNNSLTFPAQVPHAMVGVSQGIIRKFATIHGERSLLCRSFFGPAMLMLVWCCWGTAATRRRAWRCTLPSCRVTLTRCVRLATPKLSPFTCTVAAVHQGAERRHQGRLPVRRGRFAGCCPARRRRFTRCRRPRSRGGAERQQREAQEVSVVASLSLGGVDAHCAAQHSRGGKKK